MATDTKTGMCKQTHLAPYTVVATSIVFLSVDMEDDVRESRISRLGDHIAKNRERFDMEKMRPELSPSVFHAIRSVS